MFKVYSTFAVMRKVSLKEYADNHNKVLTRRGKKMSESYLYRLIREDKIKCRTFLRISYQRRVITD